MASGTTSSAIARRVNSGACSMGAAISPSSRMPRDNPPDRTTATIPTTIAARMGGTTLARRGTAPTTRNAIAIGRATATEAHTASTSPSPNRRNTPATIAMMIGMGIQSMSRRARPVSPTSRISTPVTT